MTVRRLLHAPGRMAGAVLLLIVLAAPVYLFVRLHAPPEPGRTDPPLVTVPLDSLASVPAYRGAVPVLVYHDISSRPGAATVPAKLFAEQLDALHLRGFHTISAEQMRTFLRGEGALPPRPLLIVFENGLASAWRDADPILAKYGFRAVSFVDVARVKERGYYYLGANELRAMVRSGRWDVEIQAPDRQGPIDGAGTLGAAFTNRLWLAREQRLETNAEFAARVTGELEGDAATLRGLGADATMLAYPVAPAGTTGNDAGLVHTEEVLVARRFPISIVGAHMATFVDADDVGANEPAPGTVVERATTASILVDHLASLAPVAPRVNTAIAIGQPWGPGGLGQPGSAPTIRHAALTLPAPPRHWEATYWAPARSELWRNYSVSVTIGGLAGASSGTSASLLLGAAGSAAYAVTLSAGRVNVSGTASPGPPSSRATARIGVSSRHRLMATLGAGRLRVLVDGRQMADLTIPASVHGGIGLGSWRAESNSSTPAFTRLSVEPLS